MVRTPSCDKSGLKKGTWTPEEDRKLIAYVTRYGCWNWRQLPKYAGLARCGKSCRLRWLNYLRPDIKRGNYTPEEEETIIKLHQKLGNRWSVIAAELPGRTDNDVKNHWHTNLKKHIQQNSGTQEGSAKLNCKSKEESQVESCRQEKDSVPMPINNGPFDQMGDSCPQSPQSSCSITTETTAAGNELNLVMEDEFPFLEAYTDANFWTDPYVLDMFCDPSEIVSFPSLLNQSDYFTTPSCDAQLWTQNNLYDQYTGLF